MENINKKQSQVQLAGGACKNNHYGEVEEQFHTLILKQTPQQSSQLLRAYSFHLMP